MDEDLLRKMAGSLQHSEPDDSGILLNKGDAGVIGLGHTRLSILDLSESDHQRMAMGELSIVVNCEIYSFRELRAELKMDGH